MSGETGIMVKGAPALQGHARGISQVRQRGTHSPVGRLSKRNQACFFLALPVPSILVPST